MGVRLIGVANKRSDNCPCCACARGVNVACGMQYGVREGFVLSVSADQYIYISVTAREGPDLFTEDEDERRSWLAIVVYLCSHTLPLVSP